MKNPSTSTIQETDLEPLDKMGSGGQAAVFRVSKQGVLFKKYFDPQHVHLPALIKLVDFSQKLTDVDRAWIQHRAAIPTSLVYKGSQCIGFLMPEAESAFFGLIGRSIKLRELQYLTFEPRPLWQPLEVLNLEARLTWLRHVAILFAFLHRYNLVIGDVSMRNLLWSNDPDPRPFLLDCDGLRFSGELPAVPVLQTPDWDDPSIGDGPTTIDSDRYKLAMVIHRSLLKQPKVRPENLVVDADPSVPEAVWALLKTVLSDGSAPRPPAERWIEALEGRQRVSLAPLKKRTQRVGKITPAARPAIRVTKKR